MDQVLGLQFWIPEKLTRIPEKLTWKDREKSTGKDRGYLPSLLSFSLSHLGLQLVPQIKQLGVPDACNHDHP